MVKIYLIIFVCSLAVYGHAQDRSGQSLSTGVLIPFSEPDVGEVEGNPYLLDDWSTGSVLTETGTFDTLLLRYNIASDIVDNKRGTFILSFQSGSLEAFTLHIDGRRRQFQYLGTGAVEKENYVGFYEVVSIGSISTELFVKHKKNLYGADTGAYKIQETSEYRYEPSFFIMTEGKLTKAKLTKKLCERHFGLSKSEYDERLVELGISVRD